ncbi:SWI/SNF-related matrix-associated actin-dependent regulator of chromatin subfamily A containing DEAD/H box 1 homolog [Microplitis demolitor]|uniref:SWI/SNF-related matrix-associated actin-dependent regulator of chromatin subfamily A containing DEAD/H box 1 homolog n=1 Tax=Microplitis demolitor TaxID=69319 RepID=UPI0004CD5B48|nr:SWI/SNF-related matrix-associated actin-dependent regulator of chromatin subfamily A containing DEAD/H box 1 homolog [Microplitis demolitor]
MSDLNTNNNNNNINNNNQDAISPTLSNNLRRFRFQKKPLDKLKMSDEDSNLASPDIQVRRKAVNRIEDSDSDAGPPAKSYDNKKSDSDSKDNEETSDKDEKLAYLINLHPDRDTDIIQEVLSSVNWDLDKAKAKLSSNRKRKNNSSKSNKKKRRKRRDMDEEDGDVDSDEKTYKSKVFDSDDDSDVEISNELTGDKKAVLDFMQTAMLSELLMMHQCSQKKAEAIIAARPFDDWRDLVDKFQHNKYLDTELLNSAQVLLATRNVVEVLMKKCLRLSVNMEKAVAAGSSMIKEQPKSLNPELKLTAYQMVGLNWLAVLHSQNVNGILADEMGLGKTIQVIAFLTYLKEANLVGENDGPHLIIVPSSTMNNWINEFERWSPGLNVVQYYGNPDERKDIRMGWRQGELDDVDVIITTYNLTSSSPEERRLFRVLPITYVVIDEAHMLKNMSTIRYENLVRINAKHRILLTGTPLQNNLLELMSLLVFVMPSLFAGKQNDLKSLFSKNPKIAASSKDQPFFEREQVKNAKQIMRPFVLRRLKSQVLKDLPIKTDEVIKCSLTKKQSEMYKELMSEFSEEAGSGVPFNGPGMMMQLRKLANHPLLLRNYYDESKLRPMAKKLAKDPSYKETNPDHVFDDLFWMSDYAINQLSRFHRCLAGHGLPQEMVLQSAKLEKLDELLPQMKKDGHRVLIFSQFTMLLDILEEYLTIRCHKFLRLDGQTPVPDRQALIDEYTEDPSIFIFLLSTRAGGLGINLTAADTVIIHDIDFNPYNDKQAEDRSHRMGQKKDVRIIRFLAEKTIEEGMYEIAQEKLHLEAQITENEENENTDRKSVLKLLKMTLGQDIHTKSLSLSPTKAPNKSWEEIKVEEF